MVLNNPTAFIDPNGMGVSMWQAIEDLKNDRNEYGGTWNSSGGGSVTYFTSREDAENSASQTLQRIPDALMYAELFRRGNAMLPTVLVTGTPGHFRVDPITYHMAINERDRQMDMLFTTRLGNSKEIWNPFEPYSIKLDDKATDNFFSGRDGGDDDIAFYSSLSITIGGSLKAVKKVPGVGTYLTVQSTFISVLFYLDSKNSGSIKSTYDNLNSHEGVRIEIVPYWNSYTGWNKSASFYDIKTGRKLGFLPFF